MKSVFKTNKQSSFYVCWKMKCLNLIATSSLNRENDHDPDCSKKRAQPFLKHQFFFICENHNSELKPIPENELFFGNWATKSQLSNAGRKPYHVSDVIEQ